MEIPENIPEPDEISPKLSSLKIAVPYFVLAGLWIAFSDSLVLLLFENPEAITIVQTYKGLLFVVVTASLLYLAFKAQIGNYKKIVCHFYENSINLEKTNVELVAAKEVIEEKVEELENSKEIIYQQAFYDQLTGLPNRNMFFKSNISNMTESKAVLLLLDVDNFRIINDYYGFEIGDEFLIRLAEKLKEIFAGQEAEVYRMVSDEFLIVYRDFNVLSSVEELLAEIEEFFSEPINIDGYEINSGCSIGIVEVGDDNYSVQKLLQRCETAMNEAKNNDFSNFEFYRPAMDKEIASHLKLNNDLHSALKTKEFELYYQPIYRAKDGEIAKIEALIRWYKAGEGYISPEEFIPFAEKTGLIFDIGRWVLKEVCRHKRYWQEKGITNLVTTVNLSARQLESEKFSEFALNLIAEQGINASELELEITENAVMKNFAASNKFLKNMQEVGFPIALDDFGTGYSSLSYIMNLPINNIKIDRCFISNIEQDKRQYQIVRSIIELAKLLGLEITVEGIETEEQKALLTTRNVDYLQGFYLARPASVKDLEKLL